MAEYLLTIQCDDDEGIVNAVTEGLIDARSDILEHTHFTER
jgi:formyltetrahydrofolate hydrolase